MMLKGLTIAITGGGGGIGSPLVKLLLERNADVTILSRSKPDISGIAWVACDLATESGLKSAAAALETLAPDILLHLAGSQYFGPYEQQSDQSLSDIYHINLIAPAKLTQAVLPKMLQRGKGQVIFAGSVFGSVPFAHFAAYSSAKAGLAALCCALQREYADTPLVFSLATPRAVKTAMASLSVRQFSHIAGFKFDEPEAVAQRLLGLMQQTRRKLGPGFPEAFFMKMNALTPRLVTRALKSTNAKARTLLQNQKKSVGE